MGGVDKREPQAVPIKAVRYVRNPNIVKIATNQKEHEAVVYELFQGNHIALERLVQRLTKLVKIVDTW